MINVFGASLDQEELTEIKTCIDTGWLGMGHKVKQFESDLAKRLGLLGLVMVDSGSNALYLAIQLLKTRGLPGDKIILPSFTWVSCATAVMLAGYSPLFADVDENTQNITSETIKQVFNDSVAAIMVVHYAGKPVDVHSLKQFGVPIIEDAAHAIDSKLRGISCGAMGDISIFSFNSIKNIATPEGGAIGSTDSYLLDLAREYRYCGIDKSGFATATDNANERWWEHKIKHLWPKMLPNDISASIGLAQLQKLDGLQQKRKAIWNRYQMEFSDVSWMKRPANPDDNEQHSYFTYFIRVTNGRDELARHLLDNGVYTTLRYHPLHMNSIYGSNAVLPVCETLNAQGLNLPLHPALSNNDVDKVIALIKKWKC